jgi:plastocyanin
MMVRGIRTRQLALLGGLLLAACCTARSQSTQSDGTVTGEIVIERDGVARAHAKDYSQVVVWLTPVEGAAPFVKPVKPPQIIQANKTFTPHVLAVQVGTTVEFPNNDPFFHNIFSMYDGKRFDLGLYEAGSTKAVRFDRPGVSFLFCNIHAQMSAVVLALDTPYFATSDRAGHVAIPGVPDGRYQLHVWYERSVPDKLAPLTRIVTISADARTLGTIHVAENPNYSFSHKNKYGEDYMPPPDQSYQHP